MGLPSCPTCLGSAEDEQKENQPLETVMHKMLVFVDKLGLSHSWQSGGVLGVSGCPWCVSAFGCSLEALCCHGGLVHFDL